MTIQDIHNLFDLLSDREMDGYFTPAEKDSFLDRASLWLFNDYRSIYAENVEAYDALSNFKIKLDFTTDATGLLTLSSLVGYQEYAELLNMEVSVVDATTNAARRWKVDILKEDEISSRQNSQINAPSATYPISEETSSGVFQFYPKQTHAGTVRYLKRPNKPVFGYTQSGRVITYNSGTSTQLDWPEEYQNKVVFKALQLAGINLNDEVLMQLGLQLPKENV